ncbi:MULTISPECIES: cell division ATP-binding protein FtsE [Corallincola]|uniref:Cell division ATP-binding protein FtsE n=3 Tax=Corallincola TaxID=1775176 RepID=A0A368NNU2_9GAMM|nr:MULTISPECIES: cell division ATP-binding protein FtsE [Corallincola]RCU50971.1 cell division ATP-binding protein FtsE [Corallincola holothuriorum]TAA45925.1 cell division ATP-binding protein FtsE [Corallincola spongiicola]TCI04033.1 cell division ATP-binding protein FtsE [Corallincola luteus]
MIRFDHVNKLYPGGHHAIKDVSFHLQKGEMGFLTGHSGAGKSTLLKLIALLAKPTNGQIFINGHSLSRVKKQQIPLVRRDIGIIFQDHRLLTDRSVFDNVALPLVIAGHSHKEMKRKVSAALDKVGLLNKINNLPLQLSGGEQQRVGIARAIVNKPPILLADEPTGNLDPELSAEILKLFEEFNRVDVAVLIATHDLGLIARMKYRTLTLRNGQLINDGLFQDDRGQLL